MSPSRTFPMLLRRVGVPYGSGLLKAGGYWLKPGRLVLRAVIGGAREQKKDEGIGLVV